MIPELNARKTAIRQRSGALAMALVCCGTLRAEEIDEIRVVGITPNQAAGVDDRQLAGNVQSANSDALAGQHALDLSEYINRNFSGVFVNHAQNNPLQPDVQYRGFVASPLLGLPQGMSVYQDGVRINEPFGDTVNWSLIPESAIASISLIPGSNPLYGLNTLGGALAVRTKTGKSHPGSRAEFSAGSFDRRMAAAEIGATLTDAVTAFGTLTWIDEAGWRDFSPTTATQAFANVAWEGDATSATLAVTAVDTDLIGNGPAPVDLLTVDRSAVFTRPDRTENRLVLVNLNADTRVTDAITVDAALYLRRSDITTLNGDESDFEACEEPGNDGFLCESEDGDEEPVLDPAGSAIVAAESLEGATVNRSRTEQDGAGGSLQLTFRPDPVSGFQLVAGAAVDTADIAFAASTELGALDATRQAIPGGVFAGELATELDARVESRSIFAATLLPLAEHWTVSIAARFNRSDVTLRDGIGTALNGDHSFSRLNPAIGVAYNPARGPGWYASYSEANRIPTPVELTCADEDDPCRLPNAFLADPPLDDVVSRSWEAGVRGTTDRLRWHAGLFHTVNEDDILFISAGALTNEGFFDNVGETRRQGAEISLAGTSQDRLDWSVNYSFIDATFEETLALPSPNNPAAAAGEVRVLPGDRLPLVPRQLLKANVDYAFSERFRAGAGVLASAGVSLRGDEANDTDPTASYAIVNVRAEFAVNDRASVFLSVENLLDREYETFGLFGEADEVLGDSFDNPRFLGPGTPRGVWLGVRLDL